MQRILLLSDTHGYLDPKLFKYIDSCDQIWHAGDIGSEDVIDQLSALKPLKAVYGNIDGHEVRKRCPKDQLFTSEGVDVFITHIGGYPKRYNKEALEVIRNKKPKLFICGHSHILKVVYDKEYDLLHINPGAVGMHGFHKVKTMVRFLLEKGVVKNLEVIELGNRA